MKITELLDINSIDLNPQISNKEEAIDHLVNLLDQSGKLNDKEIYKESVLNREAQSTTGIGDGVAIPHGQSEGVKTAGLSAMVVKEGLDFKSLDGQPTYLFFMIGAPKDSGGAHLQALAQLSTLLMEEDFRNALINASSKEEFLPIAKQYYMFGYDLYATEGTYKFLKEHDVPVHFVNRICEKTNTIFDLMFTDTVDLVIDIPTRNDNLKDGFLIRRFAVEAGIPIYTSLDTAKALIDSLEKRKQGVPSLIDITKLR